MPIERPRWIGGSHFEGDEYGALNEFLAVAPNATPFGTEVGVMTSINDYATQAARRLGDGVEFSIGSRRMKWLYTPHVPHGLDCGILFDVSTGTYYIKTAAADVRSAMTKLENHIAETAQSQADTNGTLEALLASGSSTVQ